MQAEGIEILCSGGGHRGRSGIEISVQRSMILYAMNEACWYAFNTWWIWQWSAFGLYGRLGQAIRHIDGIGLNVSLIVMVCVR